MLIRNANEWRNLGYYWTWANGSATIFKRPYGKGSPTINELMIESGYAFDTEDSVIEWLDSMNFVRLEISPKDILYFDDFKNIENYLSIKDVYKYLDTKNKETEVMFLPPSKYLLRGDVSEEALLRFGVKRLSLFKQVVKKSWFNKIQL